MDQLVGREREVGVLDGEVARALDGACHVVLLSGEPGIGKTRLSEEAARRAEARGAVVLRGGASQAEGMPPYLPFLEAIAGYVRSTPPDRLRAEAGPVASTLTAIVPELALLFDELAPGYPLPAEQARLRLYAAVGELLARIATRSGLVLLLDDMHWADPGSLDLLCYVASHQAAARLLVLGAHRRAAADGLERMGVELHRRRLLTSLEVAPLAAPAIAELAAVWLEGDVSPDLARRLHEESEGNPFFAEEFLRTWAEGGALRRSGGAISLDVTRAETLPVGISDCIRERLSALPPPARDHLRTAAVAGRAFETGLLAAVTESDPAELEDELLAAASAGLVRGDGQESFSFSHDKIRESLCAEVSPIRARRLHELIGHALESRDGRDGRDPSRRLAALAFHFGRSADRRRGARYEREAAEHALRAYAPAEAVAHFETALALLDREDRGRGSLLLGLGEAAGLLGQDALAVRTFEEARTWHEAVGDPVGAAGAAHALGLLRGELPALSSAQAEVDAALHLLEAQLPPDRAGLARGYAWRAMEHALQGEWPDVDLLLHSAGPLLEALGTPEHASLLHQLRGFVAYQRGEYPEAVRELQTAVAVGTSGSPSEAVTWRPALLGLGGLLALAQLAAGEEEEARAGLRELEGVLASVPEGWPAGAARTALALGWVALGHPQQALAHYPALLEMRGELHWFLVDRVLGRIDVLTADWGAARAHLGMAATTARWEGLGPEEAATRMALAELELARARTGGGARAGDHLRQARARFQELGMRGEEGRAQARARDLEQLETVLPAGLTPREVSVVRLVAAGRSNREISRALSLSEKTVANHLTSIFTKLGVDNRAGAAAFTVRNGLC